MPTSWKAGNLDRRQPTSNPDLRPTDAPDADLHTRRVSHAAALRAGMLAAMGAFVVSGSAPAAICAGLTVTVGVRALG
jgi:hypothetical protein